MLVCRDIWRPQVYIQTYRQTDIYTCRRIYCCWDCLLILNDRIKQNLIAFTYLIKWSLHKFLFQNEQNELKTMRSKGEVICSGHDLTASMSFCRQFRSENKKISGLKLAMTIIDDFFCVHMCNDNFSVIYFISKRKEKKRKKDGFVWLGFMAYQPFYVI